MSEAQVLREIKTSQEVPENLAAGDPVGDFDPLFSGRKGETELGPPVISALSHPFLGEGPLK